MMIDYVSVSMGDRNLSADLIPAPGRGQYDRRLPRERRLAEQKERLVAATARALVLSDEPSVAQVIAIAGMGRNTFYEYFDDVPHARKAAEQRALRLVEDALRGAEAQTRTPVERFRALARAWFELAATTPAELLLVLRAPLAHERARADAPSAASVPELGERPPALRVTRAGAGAAAAGLSAAGATFAAGLGRALETLRASGVAAPREPLRIAAVAASAEVFGRALSLRTVESAGAAPGPVRAELERVLVDVAVRLLR